MAVRDLYRDYRLPWFGGEGEASDVVLASRVRLARNFARLPFTNRADRQQLVEAQNRAASVFSRRWSARCWRKSSSSAKI